MKIKNLTSEQNDVIVEYVSYLKSNGGFVTGQMVEKRVLYDFKYGKGQSIELLNKNFYDIIEEYGLSELQTKKFAEELGSRENLWLVKDYSKNDVDDVVFDGHGYVRTTDGTRIDLDPDTYKEEREEHNKIRLERLEDNVTNGQEYL